MTEQMPVIIRSSSAAAEVRWPDRIIELVAVPYEVAAEIEDVYGRYTETIARGAFGNIECRGGRVRVLRDHDVTRTVGKVETFDSKNEAGLVCRMKIKDDPPHLLSQLGDETLDLAEQGLLGGSICARPRAGSDEWSQDATAVRRTDLWLIETSLTPTPAYDEAVVLAVRAQPTPPAASGTPNLDAIRAWRLEVRYRSSLTPPA